MSASQPENPALYRLMFGPALAEGNLARPASTQAAGAEAKAVLESIILRGARSGLFAIEPDNQTPARDGDTFVLVSCRWSGDAHH